MVLVVWWCYLFLSSVRHIMALDAVWHVTMDHLEGPCSAACAWWCTLCVVEVLVIVALLSLVLLVFQLRRLDLLCRLLLEG